MLDYDIEHEKAFSTCSSSNLETNEIYLQKLANEKQNEHKFDIKIDDMVFS